MLDPENMSEAARNALVHSGIDEGNEDDILAHYGVEGMKWGRRKADREERRAGGGRITTLVSFKGKPVLSLVKRTSPAQSMARKVKAANAESKAARAKLKTATDRMWEDAESKPGYPDYKSKKTIKLGRAATITALGTLGSAGISLVARSPKTFAGSFAVTTLLAGSSITLSALEKNSENKDILKKYGD